MKVYEIHIKARIEVPDEFSDNETWQVAETIALKLPKKIYPSVYYLTQIKG